MKTIAYFYVEDIILSPDSNCCTGILSINKNNSLKIFPNPSRDWIEIQENDVQSLTLYDALDRMVYSDPKIIFFPLRINISIYPKGIYFLRVKTKDSTISQKIILQ